MNLSLRPLGGPVVPDDTPQIQQEEEVQVKIMEIWGL